MEEYQRQYSATIESTFLKLTFNSKEIIIGTCEKFSQRYSNTYTKIKWFSPSNKCPIFKCKKKYLWHEHKICLNYLC